MRVIVRVLFFALLLTACRHRPTAQRSLSQSGETVFRSGSETGAAIVLPDGTRVRMKDSTVIRLPKEFGHAARDLFLDGEAVFSIDSPGAVPLVVHTRALLTRVTACPALFRVDGFRNQAGEEVDLFRGGLSVRRAYHSDADSNEPEQLSPGELVMINTDIDLMEKEKSDGALWKSWMGADEKESR